MGVKKTYIAKTGITLKDGTKDQVDLKAGDPLPDKVDQKTIDDLLSIDAIEVAES